MNINKPTLQFQEVSRILLLISIVMTLIYYIWWYRWSNVNNIYLYGLLLFGETFHVLMSISLYITLWGRKRNAIFDESILNENPKIDIFITVCGEPREIVEKTIEAAKNLDYKNKSIFVLNDGKGAKKDNWQEIDLLAKEMGVNYITREMSTGFKAGNLNEALKQTNAEYFISLDADMVIYPNFIQKTLPYMKDPKMAFVQTCQYYVNHAKNSVTQSSWEVQSLFFGTIMSSKNNYNSSILCGTNYLMRKSALEASGNFYTGSIAEDFVTSMQIHAQGYKSYYVSEILSQGLAPYDLLALVKQMSRWCRGSMQVIFTDNPLLKKGLTLNQRLQYFTSAFFYFNGIIILIDCLMPLFFFYFGWKPVSSTTSSFALFFIPYIFLNLYVLYIASAGSLTFRAISFTQSFFALQIQAFFSIIFNEKVNFVVTPKQARKKNYLFLAIPHLLYLLLGVLGIFYCIGREGIDPSTITNVAWFCFNAIMFSSFILVAYPWRSEFSVE